MFGQVRGVVASRRKKGDRVSVWVGDARRLGAVVDVGRMVSSFRLHSYVGLYVACSVRSKTKSCFEDSRTKSIIMVQKRPFEKNED